MSVHLHSFVPLSIRKRSHPGRHGFNLVEVTLALGIVAFSVIAVIGLMPIGLKSFQEANTANVEAEIAAQIARNIEATAFSRLNAFDNFKAYYDFEGREVEAESEAVFTAEVKVLDTKVQGSTITSLGRTGQPILFKTAVIELSFKPEQRRLRDQYTPKRFPIHIADRGAK